MPKPASGARRFLAAHPERLAGGLLAVERARSNAIKAEELPSWT
jgi:hypothetical protein